MARLVQTECTCGCPIGSLALELHEPDPAVRERLAKNFSNKRALAEFVLRTMEGGVMLAAARCSRRRRRPAALSAFLLGGLWYSPALFQKAWQRGAGLTDDQLQKGGHPGKVFGRALPRRPASARACSS